MPTLLRNGIIHESGGRSECIKVDYDVHGEVKGYNIVGHRPQLGCRMLVGSITARTYHDQDYWLTTEAVQILEETDERTVFVTKSGTEYTWVR